MIPAWTLDTAEALAWLQSQADASVDGLVTDPPYSSGGAFRGDRTKPTGEKYVQTGSGGAGRDFGGDNRDQRAFLVWCTLWLSEALRVLRPGAPVVVFTDWRQLPTMTDALQCGGFVWRGIGVWDKTEGTRPQMDAFRAQCEYVVWGSAGPMTRSGEVGVLPGVVRCPVERIASRDHQTQKPLKVMEWAVSIVKPGGLVMDPFAGSGSTGMAALATRRRFIGCEIDPAAAVTARERLAGERGLVAEQVSMWPTT